MFRPNTFGLWTRRMGFNEYGEPVWRGPVRVACAVVVIAPVLTPTPIRSDASASHAGSDEIDSQSTILTSPLVKLSIGDKFEIDGFRFRVVSRQANRRVQDGKIDHYEYTLDSWQN